MVGSAPLSLIELPLLSDTQNIYRGRFAPSPTGDLHLGSAVAAIASYLRARWHGGKWLIRIEDIDPPREIPGSASAIIRSLKRIGMESDEPIVYQSHHHDRYQSVLESLQAKGWAYDCACSRRDLPETGVYPGTCRKGLMAKSARMVRMRTESECVVFQDLAQGAIQQNLEHDVGDFVLKRADGFYAYQLVVVVDDAAQAITEVVRGEDLLWSTPRQIWLQKHLGFTQPGYIHIPLMLNEKGEKLSKRDLSRPIDLEHPQDVLALSLLHLGITLPSKIRQGSLSQCWRWLAQLHQGTSVTGTGEV